MNHLGQSEESYKRGESRECKEKERKGKNINYGGGIESDTKEVLFVMHRISLLILVISCHLLGRYNNASRKRGYISLLSKNNW